MNLHLDALAECLASITPLQEVIHRHGDFAYHHVLLTDNTTTLPALKDGCVVIATAASAGRLGSVSLPDGARIAVVCIGGVPEALRGSSCEIISLADDTSPAAVLNALSELFAAVARETTTYLACFYEQHDLWALLHAALGQFKNPIYAHDACYRMFAYAENRENTNLTWDYDFYTRGSLSPATIRGLLASPRFAGTFTTVGPTYYERDAAIEDFDYLYCNLWVAEEYAGRVFVDRRENPITALDYARLDFLAHLLERALADPMLIGASSTDPAAVDTLMLLETGTLSSEAAGRLQERLNLGTGGGQVICIAVDTDRNEPGTEMNLRSRLVSVLRGGLPRTVVCEYRRRIIAFCGLPATGILPEDLADSLAAISRDYEVRLGVSLPGSSPEDLPTLFKEADGALRQTPAGTPGVYRYEDIQLDYLLTRAAVGLPEAMICPTALLRLREHDRATGLDDVHTLRVFLEANCNTVKAAGLLYLHRTTLAYRLQRIGEILGEDPADSDRRLLYLLALRVLDGRDGRG